MLKNIPKDLIKIIYEYLLTEDIINLEDSTQQFFKKYSKSETEFKKYYRAQQLVEKTKRDYAESIKQEMIEKNNYERIEEYIILYKDIENICNDNYYLTYYRSFDDFEHEIRACDKPVCNNKITEENINGIFQFSKPWNTKDSWNNWYEDQQKQIGKLLAEITGKELKCEHYTPYFCNSGMQYFLYKYK